MRNRRQRAERRVALVHHVPNHPSGNRHILGRTIHAERNRPSAPKWRSHTPAYASKTEVIAEHGNTRFAKPPNNSLNFLDLLRTSRTVEQNIVPVRWIKIFDRSQRQPSIFNFSAKGLEFLRDPKLIGIAGIAPGLVLRAAGLIVPRIGSALIEIIDQVSHDMRAAGLARKVIIIARQHVPVEAKPDLHNRFPMPAP